MRIAIRPTHIFIIQDLTHIAVDARDTTIGQTVFTELIGSWDGDHIQ
jgi:hypothetical protein